ncbi:MAG: alkaline phosphatase family protein [Bacillota bacterium]|nr:alkaline phosphatase family protein [Bacillota bacterium]
MAAHVILVFVDGVGVPSHARGSPFDDPGLPTWRILGGDLPPEGREPREGRLATLVPVDAGLGLPGLPQSATGQTALLTGVNAAARLGRHRSGQPTPTLIRLLRADNLLLRLRGAGLPVALANSHSDGFLRWFARMRELWLAQEGARGRVDLHLHPPDPGRPAWLRPPASAWAADVAGVPLRGPKELERGLAVPHDLGPDPAEAGRRLAQLGRLHAFTLFEYWLTDEAGHRREASLIRARLHALDSFLGALLEASDLSETLLLVASDHGNVEEPASRRHTTNPAFLALAGAGRERLVPRLRSLVDVAGAVQEALGVSARQPMAAGPAARG